MVAPVDARTIRERENEPGVSVLEAGCLGDGAGKNYMIQREKSINTWKWSICNSSGLYFTRGILASACTHINGVTRSLGQK